jgi:DNA polymerase-3 subunit gamma/tau
MSYLVLARKWRPKTFDELTGQEPIAAILKNAITGGKVAHAYIFSGPRGVGKTSTARILAKSLNCEHGPTTDPCGSCASCSAIADGSSMDVSEIDGASNTGVDNIRDLRERVRYASSGGRYKVYIIDEAHMLSTAAFNALLKTLEEPPPHVIFVLATTEPKRIPATVLSRCQHLPFRRITTHKIKERLRTIVDQEGIAITDSALEMIARAADGSMRDSLTVLDQIASFSDDIKASDVKDLLGFTDMETLRRLARDIITGDRGDIIYCIADLAENGADLKLLTRDLLHFMRDLLITRIVGDPSGILDLSEEEIAAVHELKGLTSEEHLSLVLSELIKAEPVIRSALFPRIAIEMALIRMSMLSRFAAIDEALTALGGTATPASSVQKPRSLAAPAPAGNPAPAAAPRPVSEPAPKPAMPAPAAHSENKPEKPRASVLPVDQALWESIVERIDDTNHPLASKLRETKAIVTETQITLQFNGGAAVLAESVRENLKMVQTMIRDLSGKTVPITIETIKVHTPSKGELKEQALNHPLVKEALELFDGRITDVFPITDKEGGSNV